MGYHTDVLPFETSLHLAPPPLDPTSASDGTVTDVPDHLHLSTEPSVDLALGNLIRILSTLAPCTGITSAVPAMDLLAWFADRFHLPEGSCSPKALGDALAFANRLGLIRVEKIIRTRAKIVHYNGVDLQKLDEASNSRSRSASLPSKDLPEHAAKVSGLAAIDEVPPSLADLATELNRPPIDDLDAKHQQMIRELIEQYPDGIPEDAWY